MDFSNFLDAGFGVMDKWASKKWSNENSPTETAAPVVIQQSSSTSVWTWVGLGAAVLVLLVVLLKR